MGLTLLRRSCWIWFLQEPFFLLPEQLKEALIRKMISTEMKSREKNFRMNPGVTYFPVLVVEIFKIEIREILTKNFEKRSHGPSQRT